MIKLCYTNLKFSYPKQGVIMSFTAAAFTYNRHCVERATMPTKDLMLAYSDLRRLAASIISGNY